MYSMQSMQYILHSTLGANTLSEGIFQQPRQKGWMYYLWTVFQSAGLGALNVL